MVTSSLEEKVRSESLRKRLNAEKLFYIAHDLFRGLREGSSQYVTVAKTNNRIYSTSREEGNLAEKLDVLVKMGVMEKVEMPEGPHIHYRFTETGARALAQEQGDLYFHYWITGFTPFDQNAKQLAADLKSKPFASSTLQDMLELKADTVSDLIHRLENKGTIIKAADKWQFSQNALAAAMGRYTKIHHREGGRYKKFREPSQEA